MALFALRRLVLAIPLLIGITFISFIVIQLAPGGPFDYIRGEESGQDAKLVERLNKEYGLDQPIYVQYGKYVEQLATFQFGASSTSRQPVTTEFRQRFPATVELAFAAGLFALVFGIPLGFVAAKRYQGVVDHTSLVVSLIGISTPIFFLALILKYIFSVRLGWLPSVGRMSVLIDIPHPTNFYLLDAILARNWEAFVDVSKHLILPAIALGSIPLAIIARITRASVLDVQNEDYVRTAQAKGLAPRAIDVRHVLRNAMLPIATIIGLQVGLLLSGAVLTETVFAFPGIGSWLVDAIKARNYSVIQGGVLFVAIIVVFVNLLVDVSYGMLNPRIRLSK
jgi:peptide/nickel transport system permease protein